MSLAEANFKENKYSHPFDLLKRPQYDWKRKKKLSTNHSKYTMPWLISNAKYFESLNFLQRILLILFWTKRNICHSFKEIAQDCGLCDDHAAVLLMKMLESVGFLEIKNQSYKGKHCGRNWYKLTYKGQKILKLVLNKAFKGTPIPTELLPIEIKKKYPNWVRQEPQKSKVSKTSKDLFEESSKNFSKGITKSLLRKNNKKNMLEQPDGCSLFSFERKEEVSREWLIWNPALFDSGSLRVFFLGKNYFKSKRSTQKHFETPEYKRRKKLIQEYESFKTCERRKLFESFGFIEHYDAMHIGIWRILEKEPIEKITKALKLLQKKLSKKRFRMKSFVGFFTHLMKKAEHMGYNTYKAEVYRDAIDDKKTPATERLLSGHDSSEFVAIAKELEGKTGEKVPLKTLKWMLGKGDSQVWLKAIQAVKFRLHLDGPRKTKTRTENVYELRKKKETRMEQEAMRDSSGKLIRDENGKIRWHMVEKTDDTGFFEEVLVGTREVPIEDHGKAPKEKIKSWVGLWVYAVKLGSVEAINEQFFLKREEELKPMPRLPGCGEQ